MTFSQKQLAAILAVLLLAGCGSRKIEPLVSVTTPEKISATTLFQQVSEDRLRSYIADIFNTRRYYKSERSQTFASIEAQVSGLNYSIDSQDFFFSRYNGKNLVLTKTGTVTPNNWIVLVAHYDTVYDAPGADDNGSGCAALIETAKILSGITFESTLKLVFVDLEEEGFLGSQDFVSLIPTGTKVVAAISLEMLGYTSAVQQNPFPSPFEANQGNFLTVIGDGKSFSMANDFVRNLKNNNISLPTIIVNPDEEAINNPLFQDLMRSDHASFWLYGFPAIMITDTANYRNPNYHQSTDEMATLDFAFLKKATQAVVTSACLWAKPTN